jgi:hypothetical protein
MKVRRIQFVGFLCLGLAGCTPQAIFFHESTKVGFSATYNTSDSQPISSHFGFKRRIAAAVPGQVRVPAANGNPNDATNQGEALSMVSKFYVQAGSRTDGITIRTNFATGNAARALTVAPGSTRAIQALMQNQVVVAPESTPSTAMSAADLERLARNKARQTNPRKIPAAVEEVSVKSPNSATTLVTPTPLPKARATPSPAVRATPPPALRGTPTPPPATEEVGADGITLPIPTATPQ